MHLVVAISAHGFGHGAQVAPVVNALGRWLPSLKVTVRTTVPRWFLAARLTEPFDYQPHASDFGLEMSSPLDVRLEATARRYRTLHARWEAAVEAEAAALDGLGADLLLADVPYLSLAAARRLGLPAAALCSLNWAGIYRHYFGRRREAGRVLAQMEDAYNSARVFLRPAPAMAMPELTNARSVGPVARIGRSRREGLDRRLGLKAQERLVLLAPGGVSGGFPVDAWPRLPGVRWVVPRDWGVRRCDALSIESLGLDFTDLVCSVDALVGKCGYGTVTECACNGTPMVYVARPEWPEEAALVRWLRTHNRSACVSREELAGGRLEAALGACWSAPAPTPPAPTGADEAAAVLAELAG